MDFSLSNEQKMMLDTIRRFIADELKPLEQAVEDSGELPAKKARDIFQKSKALGFYGLNISAQLGGGGLNAVDMMLCEEQFGDTTDILIRRAFGDAYEALLACKGPQVARWLKPTVQGERTCSIAITERRETPYQ
jgi:acyl-CoA dehydrogenase